MMTKTCFSFLAIFGLLRAHARAAEQEENGSGGTRPRLARAWSCVLLAVALLFSGSANAQVEFQIVHAFGALGDGEGLGSAVVVDAAGDLFGTAGGGVYGQGMVYELSPGGSGTWTETIPHSFGAPHSGDGINPYGPVTLGSGGVLYGATPGGGTDKQDCLFVDSEPRRLGGEHSLQLPPIRQRGRLLQQPGARCTGQLIRQGRYVRAFPGPKRLDLYSYLQLEIHLQL